MVSVKDKEIYSKRMAFLQTIQMHKQMATTHAHAVFCSSSERFPNASSVNQQIYDRKVSVQPNMYQTEATKFVADDSLFEPSKMGRSSVHADGFASTFHTSLNNPNQSTSLFSEKKYTSQDYNPQFGFNSS